jgi:hypothetical protein
MGNQGSSGEGVNLTCEWIWNGEIGEVTRVDAFTDRPIWPQGLERPEEVHEIPSTLNWDAFIGPAPKRPYNSIYHPWNFRGWWDFGTGALGDMACHILHPVFKALDLGYPIKAEGSSTPLMSDCCPSAQVVKLTSPARPNRPKVAMPEVVVTWSDGGIVPFRPDGLPVGKDLNVSGGGAIFYGTKDILVVGCYGEKPYLVSGRVPNAPKVCRRVTESHQRDLLLGLSRGCIAGHFPAGVTDKEHVVLPVGKIAPDQCFADSGGGFPVDVVDVVAVAVLSEVVKIKTAPMLHGAVVPFENIRRLPLRIERGDPAHPVEVVVTQVDLHGVGTLSTSISMSDSTDTLSATAA